MKPRPGTAGGCSPSAPHESIYRLTEGRREGGREKDVEWVDGGKQDREQKVKVGDRR